MKVTWEPPARRKRWTKNWIDCTSRKEKWIDTYVKPENWLVNWLRVWLPHGGQGVHFNITTCSNEKQQRNNTIKNKNVTYYLAWDQMQQVMQLNNSAASATSCKANVWRGGEYRRVRRLFVFIVQTLRGTSLLLANLSLHTILQTCTCEGRATTLQQVQTGLLGCGKTNG